MDTAIYFLAYSAATFLGFLSLKYFDKRLTLASGIVFTIYIGLSDLVTGLGLDTFRFLDAGYWNWSGKIWSLLLSIVVMLALGMNANAAGLVLPRRNIKAGVIALVPLILTGVVLGLVYEPEAPTAETIAFQLLMPSAAEELMFRGIAPALLLGLIRGRHPPQATPWVVICITAIPFGLVHGLSYSGGAFSFDLDPTLWTLSGGVIYGWLRFSSGSLLFPLLAHSLANVAFHLTALIGA